MKTTPLHFVLSLLLLIFSSSSFSQTVNQKDGQGRKQGKWIEKYAGTTSIKYKGFFKDGKPTGLFVFYYESGKVKAKNKYSNRGQNSYASTYYENGKLMSMGKYVNQKKDSIWVYMDQWGNYVSKESYKSGKKHGKCIDFYPFNPRFDQGRPQILEITFYQEGEKDGEYQRFYKNGKVLKEGKFSLGELEGKVTTYYPTGTKRTEIHYKHGLKHGYTMNYDGNGKLTSKQYFIKGYELKGKQLERHLERKREKARKRATQN